MKPLSPLQYIRKNIKKVLPIFISVAVGVFMVYFYSLFSETTIKMEEVAIFDVMEKYSIVYTNDERALPDTFLSEINHSAGDEAIGAQLLSTGLPYYRGGLGGTSILIFNLFEDDTKHLLDAYDVELIEGDFPRDNCSQMLIPYQLALQKHIGVGDFIGSEVSNEYSLPGRYEICGLTEGPVLFTVVCQPGDLTEQQFFQRGILYPVDQIDKDMQNDLLAELPDYVTYHTYDTYHAELAVTLTAMQSLTYILTIVMVVVLCITLSNLYVILFAGRKDEFYILYAVGYTKLNLSRKLWMENLIVCAAGYILGIGLTIFIVWLINIAILFPQGKVLTMLCTSGILSALAIPVFVSFFSLLPSLLHNFTKRADVSI